MKHISIKIVAMMLALLTVLSCMALMSCTDEEPVDTPDTPAQDTDTPADEPTDDDEDSGEDYLLSIPAQNYGKTFTFLTDVSDDRRMELFVKDENEAAGDLMDTAIFYRNNRIAEYLGVTFESITSPGGWQDRDEYINRVYASFSTGDQDFQMLSCYMAFAANGAVAGYYYDINSIDAIDTNDAWYVQSWFENTVVNDQCYMLLGDLSYSMWKNLNAIYFNKQISDELGLSESLYQLAADGDWTFEYLMECAQMSSVENGNDVWDTEDTYGLHLNRFNCRAMVTYFDIPLTKLNKDGEYEICLYNERTEEIYGTIHSYIWNNDCVYKNTINDGDTVTGMNMFVEDRLFFLPATLSYSQDLRQMEGAWGILPAPKLDANQESYRSHSNDNFNVFMIPGHAEDAEFCGTVVDALGAESKYSVIPTYYDVVLKGRTTKDEQSAAMLDIIRDNLSFDFSFAHIASMEYMWTKFGQNLLIEANTSFKPQYDKDESKFQTKLEEIMASYWDVH